MLKIKNVRDSKTKEDGFRILIDRLWPRGITKQKAAIDLWLKDIAPSNELRKWYSHDETKWEEFKKRYFEELKDKKDLLKIILDKENQTSVTLIFDSKSKLNNAKALIEYIKK
ncbi:MAG: DUF488 family protein [Candidatus Omnitrophica bacterium]|jgi:uncharacterized protein YeaO (DUF488 family)|nr:DUF488 family protein [Candidatus Omnitrophota bacterium]